ncbi:MAG TPA: hypothetical protein VFY69_03850 [Solirubrobacterales bacterium]|nr:hypothetical protein [Solirubrobacterales bacterium]
MRIPAHKPIVLLLAALAALLIAGCGGGDDETTETAPVTTEEPQTLTKAELIEQGDAICAEVNAAVGALGAEAEEATVPDTIEKSANLYTGMIERIQDLGRPEGDDGSYAEFMEAAEEFAKVEGEVKLAAEREDTTALGEAATEAAPALENFQEAAEEYGFEDCAEGPSEPTSAGTAPEGAEPGAEEFEGGEEEGGIEPEAEFEEEAAPEEEIVPEEEAAPETGGAGGGAEAAPEEGGGESGGSESGGVGPG